MPVPKPAAMWPLTITAGVNDKIDVYAGSTEYHATIAPATYYTPAALAAAVQAALAAAVAMTNIVAGVNDRLDVGIGGVVYTPNPATLTPGIYSAAALATEMQTQLDANHANGWAVSVVGGKIEIRGTTAFQPQGATGQNVARSAWPTCGFLAEDYSPGDTVIDAANAPTVVAWTVSVSSAGRVTIANSSGLSFVLRFSTGGNAATSARSVLGFGTVNTASGTTATGANQAQNCWFPEEPVADDTRDLAVHERSQTVALGGAAKSLHFGTRYRRDIRFGLLPPQKVFTEDEGTTYANEAFARLQTSGWARFRWFDDATDLSTGTDYVLDIDTAKQQERSRLSPGSALYGLTLHLRKYV